MKPDAARALAALAIVTARGSSSDIAIQTYGRVGDTYWLDALKTEGATDSDLLEAHRLGLIHLVRIDLVAAFEEARVQASAVYLGRPESPLATFHCVELGR